MAEEMGAAVEAAGADTARRDAALDAIVTRYQPEADAFAAELQTFADSQLAGMPADQQTAMRNGIAATLTQIRGVPAMVRAQVEQAATAPAPATPAN